jgi:transcriptional regulator with XRE-family HTH domain
MRKRMHRKSQTFLQDLGDMIRNRRVECGFSQEELGKRCEVHRTYITEIENGLRNVSVLTVEKIAEALNLHSWRLFRFERLNPGNGEIDGDGN